MRTKSNGFVKSFRSVTATPTMRMSLAGDTLTHMMPNGSQINDIKPKLLETRIAESNEFFRLSDGFKQIFANDKKDKKIVIPVCGYGGHRRGDRSQNFFGKSFREVAVQSKRLQRSLQKGGSLQRE